MTQINKIFSPVMGLLLPCLLYAQTDVSNTGTLGISPAGTFYVTGSFNNSGTATLVNRGSLHVLQGLINAQPAMTTGAGTLYLDGSALQTISGPQPYNTFNLVTANAAGILLNNDLNVSGVHTFVAGIINTDAVPHYLGYQDGASYTGYADARHIHGWIRKTGSVDFTFPLGNGTWARPVALSNLSALSVFTATYASPTFNTGSITPPLSVINLNEYWTINKTSGGTATVDLYWDNNKVPITPYTLSDMRAAGYIGGSWITLGGTATGNITTTGTIRSNPLSVFGPLTIGSLSAAGALPVTIISFTAYAGNGGNILSWTTADEINVSQYDLQRSDDGINFYSLTNIAALNGTGTQQYNFTDSKPVQQTVAYYRLRSVDKDGQTKLSKIITVTNSTTNPALMYAVNPAHGNIELQVQRVTGTLRYKVSNLSGQTMQSGVLTVGLPGRYHIPLLPAMAHGVYVLQLDKPGFVFTQRLLVD